MICHSEESPGNARHRTPQPGATENSVDRFPHLDFTGTTAVCLTESSHSRIHIGRGSRLQG